MERIATISGGSRPAAPNEVQAAALVAEAFGYVDRAAVDRPLELVDRVLAMLYRMTQ